MGVDRRLRNRCGRLRRVGGRRPGGPLGLRAARVHLALGARRAGRPSRPLRNSDQAARPRDGGRRGDPGRRGARAGVALGQRWGGRVRSRGSDGRGSGPRRGVGASLPFIASGRVGILGVGLVNDDMASHLVIADWIGSHAGPVPKLVDQGYPVGPHALVDGVSSVLGSGLVDAFAGLTLALPVLMAAVAAGVLADLRPGRRTVAAALVALSYLGAAYLAQEAFKEPIEALFVLGFALLLPSVRDRRVAMPARRDRRGGGLRVQLPGLGVARRDGGGVSGSSRVSWRRRRDGVTRRRIGGEYTSSLAPWPRRPLASSSLLVAPEVPRLIDFTGFRAFRSAVDQRRARQPPPPALAARGARRLADERVPPRRGRQLASAPLLRGRAARPRRPVPGGAALAEAAGTRRPGRARGRGRDLPRRARSSAPSTPRPRRSRSRPRW